MSETSVTHLKGKRRNGAKLLGWPKGLSRIFCKVLRKHSNEILASQILASSGSLIKYKKSQRKDPLSLSI